MLVYRMMLTVQIKCNKTFMRINAMIIRQIKYAHTIF